MEVTKMDGLSSESEAQKPAEEQKPEDTKDTKDTEDTKGTAKPKKPRVARKKLPPAAADVPAAAPAVDAAFFGKLGSTLRDLRREAKTQKFSNFVVA